MQIEFRPVGNVEQVLHLLDVTPNEPRAMCTVTSSPSQLLYRDHTYKVHQIDCSTVPPRVLREEIPFECDGQVDVYDVCKSGDFLLVTRSHEGVFVYTLRGGECKWRVSGKLPGMRCKIDALGVTADERGHLFVSDCRNECVHIMSERDGAHLGVVVRE